MGVFANVVPFREELELHELPKIDISRKFALVLLRVVVDAELVVPFVPRLVAERFF